MPSNYNFLCLRAAPREERQRWRGGHQHNRVWRAGEHFHARKLHPRRSNSINMCSKCGHQVDRAFLIRFPPRFQTVVIVGVVWHMYSTDRVHAMFSATSLSRFEFEICCLSDYVFAGCWSSSHLVSVALSILHVCVETNSRINNVLGGVLRGLLKLSAAIAFPANNRLSPMMVRRHMSNNTKAFFQVLREVLS